MICEFCQHENITSYVFEGVGSTTLAYSSPFWDETGIYHIHDPNTTFSNFECSNGHKWSKKTKHACPDCDWPE